MPLSRINTSSIANNTIIAADIGANTITGDKLVANTLANSVFQTGSVESYLNAQSLNLSQRNRTINGCMRYDQRNVGANVTPSLASGDVYVVDRWVAQGSQSLKLSFQQMDAANTSASNYESGSAPTGFNCSIKVKSTTAYSVTSGDYFDLYQYIEGLNVFDLGFGTSSARPITLSFWVKSSLTGTFGGIISNNNYSRCYGYSYTIVSANTWEQKFITIPGDQSGTWLKDTGRGMQVSFSFAVGSTYGVAAGSWGGSQVLGITGQTSLVGTSGATMYLTGIQVEAGSQATPFEFRHYATELAMCQRYFNKTYSQSIPLGSTDSTGQICWTASNTSAWLNHRFPVSMRAIPTVTVYSVANAGYNNFNNFADNSTVTVSPTNIGTEGTRYDCTGTVSGTRFGGHLVASAEL
jgi:hypothetical protein